MNRRFIIFLFVVVVLALGCQNPNERLKLKVTKVITSYMEKNMDGFTVDSVNIMGIDSLTDLEFAYFQKIIYENRESELLSNRMLYIYPITDEEYDKKEELQSQLQGIQNRIQLCDSILLDIKTDTVAINYFFVAAKIFGKDKQGEIHLHEIGFPMDKNLTVKEIDWGN